MATAAKHSKRKQKYEENKKKSLWIFLTRTRSVQVHTNYVRARNVNIPKYTYSHNMIQPNQAKSIFFIFFFFFIPFHFCFFLGASSHWICWQRSHEQRNSLSIAASAAFINFGILFIFVLCCYYIYCCYFILYCQSVYVWWVWVWVWDVAQRKTSSPVYFQATAHCRCRCLAAAAAAAHKNNILSHLCTKYEKKQVFFLCSLALRSTSWVGERNRKRCRHAHTNDNSNHWALREDWMWCGWHLHREDAVHVQHNSCLLAERRMPDCSRHDTPEIHIAASVPAFAFLPRCLAVFFSFSLYFSIAVWDLHPMVQCNELTGFGTMRKNALLWFTADRDPLRDCETWAQLLSYPWLRKRKTAHCAIAECTRRETRTL